MIHLGQRLSFFTSSGLFVQETGTSDIISNQNKVDILCFKFVRSRTIRFQIRRYSRKHVEKIHSKIISSARNLQHGVVSTMDRCLQHALYHFPLNIRFGGHSSRIRFRNKTTVSWTIAHFQQNSSFQRGLLPSYVNRSYLS